MRKRGISHRLLVIMLDLILLLLINVALLVLDRTNFRYLGLRGVLAQMALSVPFRAKRRILKILRNRSSWVCGGRGSRRGCCPRR